MTETEKEATLEELVRRQLRSAGTAEGVRRVALGSIGVEGTNSPDAESKSANGGRGVRVPLTITGLSRETKLIRVIEVCERVAPVATAYLERQSSGTDQWCTATVLFQAEDT